MRGGYLGRAVEILQANLPHPPVVTNLSVGSTSTITAIARLSDLPAGHRPDLILYEYALNDAAHFSARPDGAELQRFVIRLLIDELAARFPDAVLAPVLLGSAEMFSAHVRNTAHDAQCALWSEADIPHLDVRRRLAYIFVNSAPAWLYADFSHYGTPHGSDIVGAMTGRFLVELSLGKRGVTLRECAARLAERHGPLAFGIDALSAADLAAGATGNWEMLERRNALMAVPALRLRQGAMLALPAQPFNIALLADRRHDLVTLTRHGDDRPSAWSLATRLSAVDNPAMNPPDKDRFFYAGIPLSLVLAQGAPIPSDDASFSIAIPDETDERLPVIGYDRFILRSRSIADRYLDVVGALFLRRKEVSPTAAQTLD